MPTLRAFAGFVPFCRYYAGSQDYWNHESLCWAGGVVNGCFENSTGTGEPVTGLDLHRNFDQINSSEYATVLYTSQADTIIAAHAAAYARPPPSNPAGGPATSTSFHDSSCWDQFSHSSRPVPPRHAHATHTPGDVQYYALPSAPYSLDGD